MPWVWKPCMRKKEVCKAMKWTHEPPAKPGWYFWRTADSYRVFHVGWRGNTHRLGYGVEKGSACLNFGTPGEEWAGPIPEPMDEEE